MDKNKRWWNFNAYYFCINPTPQTERYDKYLDIPHYEITGDNVDKIYDYASACAEMGADWCTVQELMAANKIGAITLNAQNITYSHDETCTLNTTFNGTATYARYPSKFCMEKKQQEEKPVPANTFLQNTMTSM